VVKSSDSKWYPDLEQALAASRQKWQYFCLVEIAPDLIGELRRITKSVDVPEDFRGQEERSRGLEGRVERLIRDLDRKERGLLLRNLDRKERCLLQALLPSYQESDLEELRSLLPAQLPSYQGLDLEGLRSILNTIDPFPDEYHYFNEKEEFIIKGIKVFMNEQGWNEWEDDEDEEDLQQTQTPSPQDMDGEPDDHEPDGIPPAPPDSPVAHIHNAHRLAAKEDWKGAIAEYSEAIRLDYSLNYKLSSRARAEAHSCRAECYRRTGEFRLAVADDNEALRWMPDDNYLRIQRGYSKYGLGDYVSAVEDYNQVIIRSKHVMELILAYHGRSEIFKAMREAKYAELDMIIATALAKEYNGLDDIGMSEEEFADINRVKAAKQQKS